MSKSKSFLSVAVWQKRPTTSPGYCLPACCSCLRCARRRELTLPRLERGVTTE